MLECEGWLREFASSLETCLANIVACCRWCRSWRRSGSGMRLPPTWTMPGTSMREAPRCVVLACALSKVLSGDTTCRMRVASFSQCTELRSSEKSQQLDYYTVMHTHLIVIIHEPFRECNQKFQFAGQIETFQENTLVVNVAVQYDCGIFHL